MRYFVIFCIGFLAFSVDVNAQEWSTPVQVSQGGYNREADFCIDNIGNIHCVYSRKYTDYYYKIYYTKSEDGGQSWSKPEDVFNNDTMWIDQPNIAVDTSNVVHVTCTYDIYNSNHTFIALTKRTEEGWHSHENISENMFGSRSNKIAIDNNNRLYVFWYKNESFYFKYLENGYWSEITCPYDNNNYHGLTKLKIDSSNNLHCLGSFHYDGQSHYDDQAIYFKYNYKSDNWLEPTILSDERTWWGKDIALDNFDNPRAVWGQNYNNSYELFGSFYSYFNNNEWTLSELVSSETDNCIIEIDWNNNTNIIANYRTGGTVKLKQFTKKNNTWFETEIVSYQGSLIPIKIIKNDNLLFLLHSQISDSKAMSDFYLTSHRVPEVGINELYGNRNTLNSFPNPFAKSTSFSFSLEKAADVTLQIYNQQGQLVDKIEKQKLTAGDHQIEWQCVDNPNNPPSIYMVSLVVDGVRVGSVKVLKVE
jgi:hypothetical protein